MEQNVYARARRIISENPNSVFITVDEGGRPVDRVMWTARVDDDLTVYYATALNSPKVNRIRSNPRVLAVWFGNGSYVSLKGTAEVTTDREVLDSLWRDSFARYFPGGRTDPNYAAIKIVPQDVSCSQGCETGVDVVDLH